MTKRGRVLRDPNAGPGLLMVEGRQYLFARERVWTSDTPPKPGLVVDVELDGVGKILAINVVPETQLAKEQADAALTLAHEKGGGPASSLAARGGMPGLIAVSILAAAWWFLTAVSIQVQLLGELEFTFWQLLELLNAGNALDLLDGQGNASVGIYGVLAVIAPAGPFIHHFWKDRRALLGGLLPLALMVIVGFAIRSRIENAKVLSLGWGSYLSILVGLYFAFTSAKRFLVAKASEGHQLQPAVRKAA